jgi:hypothetical protein
VSTRFEIGTWLCVGLVGALVSGCFPGVETDDDAAADTFVADTRARKLLREPGARDGGGDGW